MSSGGDSQLLCRFTLHLSLSHDQKIESKMTRHTAGQIAAFIFFRLMDFLFIYFLFILVMTQFVRDILKSFFVQLLCQTHQLFAVKGLNWFTFNVI